MAIKKLEDIGIEKKNGVSSETKLTKRPNNFVPEIIIKLNRSRRLTAKKNKLCSAKMDAIPIQENLAEQNA